MIPFRVHTGVGEVESLLAGLGRPEAVLSLTFFVRAADPESHAAATRGIRDALRRVFPEGPPPASIVAQAPESGRAAALEALLLDPGYELERLSAGEDRYTVARGPGVRQVHGAGLAAGDPGECFARMGRILEREGLHFGHVVRQWGYIEGMLEVRGGRQGYQRFNDARSAAYARSEFASGYPAATGIGQATGGVVLEFIALAPGEGLGIVPISNPRQVDAHGYSEGVLVGEKTGKAVPKFERAKRVSRDGSEIIFVSGTASILGEQTVAAGDVAAQTETTLDNIALLVPTGGLSHLRAYVKRPEDIPVVRRVCEARLGRVPGLYVTADVCRDDLLVEIEGFSLGGKR